jgi:hypothetical protein
MFVSRKQDNSIYGCWTVKQHDGQEELADDHPEVVAFMAPKVPTASQIIDAAFPQTGTARVLFEALFSLSNQVRELRTQMNAELVARGQAAAYPNNATEGGAAQVTKPQLKAWLESKLP